MPIMLQLFLFSIGVWAVIVAGLICCKKYIKKDRTKDLVFIIVSLVTVLIHYSYHLIEMMKGNHPAIEVNLYLPFYACNVMMWSCTTVAFLMLIKKKNSRIFKMFAEFTAFVGTVCAFFGELVNANFFTTPSFTDFYVLRSLLSHSTMLYSCVYLFVMDYIKIDMKHNMLSVIMGEVIMFICGLYSSLVVPGANAMLIEKGFDNSFYWINFGIIVISTLGATVVFFAIYDRVKKPKEERWYHKIWF